MYIQTVTFLFFMSINNNVQVDEKKGDSSKRKADESAETPETSKLYRLMAACIFTLCISDSLNMQREPAAVICHQVHLALVLYTIQSALVILHQQLYILMK